MNSVSIQLFSTFTLTDEFGNDLTPKGKKEKAVCAVLACSPGFICTREKLRGLLWSDRSRDQAQISLRQTLKRIRTTLNTHSEFLITDRTYVSLDPKFLCFSALPKDLSGVDVIRNPHCFLSSLDIIDIKFKQWRELERTSVKERLSQRPPHAYSQSNTVENTKTNSILDFLNSIPMRRDEVEGISNLTSKARLEIPTIDFYRPLVSNSSQCDHSQEHHLIIEFICSEIVMNVNSLGLAVIRDMMQLPYEAAFPSNALPSNISTRTAIHCDSKSYYLYLTVMDNRDFSTIYNTTEEFAVGSSLNRRIAIGAIVQRYIDFLMTYNTQYIIKNPEAESAQLSASLVMKGLFMPGSLGIDALRDNICLAIKLKPHPLYHTMQATLALMQYGERLSSANRTEITEMTIEDLKLSLADCGENSIVLAWNGHVQGYFMQEHEISLNLTKRAIELSPYSWLCWMFRATTLSYANKGEEAQRAINTTLSLPIPACFKPFVLSNAAQAECLAGNFIRAKRYAEEALMYNSKFHATSRTLLTAYSNMGDTLNSYKLFSKLKKRESDLTIELIRSDEYPIPSSTVRNMLVSGLNKIGLPGEYT